MFLIDDSTEVHVNLIPSTQDFGLKGSHALVQSRIINKEEKDFINHTLFLMALGFIIILVFLIILMKSMDLP